MCKIRWPILCLIVRLIFDCSVAWVCLIRLHLNVPLVLQSHTDIKHKYSCISVSCCVAICFIFQLKGPLLKEQREKKFHTHKISVREYVPVLSVHKLISDIITCWQTALCQFYLLSNLSLTVLSADKLTSYNIICWHINTWPYYRLTNLSLTFLPVYKLISDIITCWQPDLCQFYLLSTLTLIALFADKPPYYLH